MGAAIGSMLSAIGAAISEALISSGLATAVTTTTYAVGDVAYVAGLATINELVLTGTTVSLTPTLTGYAVGGAVAAGIVGGVVAGSLASKSDNLGSGHTLTNIIGTGTPGKAFEHIFTCPSLIQQLEKHVSSGYKSCRVWDIRPMAQRLQARQKVNGGQVHAKKKSVKQVLEQPTTSSNNGSNEGGKMDGTRKRLR